MEESYSVKLELRALDPETDIDLFREAFNWRRHNSKLYPDKMAFEDFAANDPSQIVMGLFNGSLCVVYVFREGPRGTFDAHFTSRRRVPREYIVAGGRWMVKWFTQNGAQEVTAYIVERNGPLRRLVLDVGFVAEGLVDFPCGQNDTDSGKVSSVRRFVKYAVRSR